MNLSYLAAAAVAIPLAAFAAEADPLLAERWKTRPIVVVVPDAQSPLLRKVEAALAETAVREAFAEREMVLYTVVDGTGRRAGQSLRAAQTRALLATLKLQARGAPTFVLVGKDGGTKMVEGTDVDLKAVFAEIDRMPMRQAR